MNVVQTLRSMAVATALLLQPTAAAVAAEPIRRIDIFVQPYYEAARTAAGSPRVAVGKAWDALLASEHADDVAKARDGIAANPALITPMTLMVLAVRLYDVGLRDDAVFWFYVAKDRYATLAAVAEVRAAPLVQVEDAVRSFALLAGPHINGYAFCDVARQQVLRARAMQWTREHPYQALFLPQVPALPGERRDNLARGLDQLQAAVDQERRYLAEPANLQNLRQQRERNELDAKYCWKQGDVSPSPR
jgi:hypothetical protein